MADEKSKTLKEETQVDQDKKALGKAKSALRIKANDILSHKVYSDKVVIVTTAGQKRTWNRK